ncbi:prepilin peptidase [Stigmatella hybrida]|uniref:prepilin peptidase n=1 Tax=Stigmatella hybrida TaxID=394097 RepID=UPI001CDB32A3|nr:A24 family peptidase [Stigmatella hybrida]
MDLELTPFPSALLASWLFVLGLCVGSFLNVVIARVPAGQSIVRPRSRCPKCGYTLTWYDNIPLVSWLVLRGRCRGCAAPISVRYPLVELATGLLFLACWRRFGLSWELLSGLVLITLLIPLTFIDLEHWILPFSLTVPGIVLGVGLAGLLGVEALRDAAVGAAVGFLVFRLMEYLGWKLLRKEALGGGDKYLVAMLGGFLTWRSLLGILFLSSFQGAVVGILLIVLTGRAGPRAEGQGNAQEPAQEAPEPELTMTWEFLKPGIPLWRRLLWAPVCLLFQPIPDEPKDEAGEEIDWVPGKTNIPFGPWLALAGLEILLLGPWLTRVLPPNLALLVGGLP